MRHFTGEGAAARVECQAPDISSCAGTPCQAVLSSAHAQAAFRSTNSCSRSSRDCCFAAGSGSACGGCGGSGCAGCSPAMNCCTAGQYCSTQS